jgi:hypothetical protein
MTPKSPEEDLRQKRCQIRRASRAQRFVMSVEPYTECYIDPEVVIIALTIRFDEDGAADRES